MEYIKKLLAQIEEDIEDGRITRADGNRLTRYIMKFEMEEQANE